MIKKAVNKENKKPWSLRRTAWCFWHSQQPYKNLYREKAKKRPSRGLFRCCCLFLGLSFVICRFCCKKTDVRLHKRRITAGRFAARRNILGIVRWPKEDMSHFFFYRAINGKLVGSHSIGCHALCFRGRDDNGCNSWKVLSQSRNLQTCNVIRKNRWSTLVLRHLEPSPKVSLKITQTKVYCTGSQSYVS